MKLLQFIKTVCATEESAVAYLRHMGVFSTEMMSPEEGCDKLMKSDMKRLHWRCNNRSCRKELRMCGESSFFNYKEKPGRGHVHLRLNEILELLYMFIFTRSTIREVAYTSSHSSATIVDSYNMMREVCTHSVTNEPEMVRSVNNPVQRDESYFSGRGKYRKLSELVKFCSIQTTGINFNL